MLVRPAEIWHSEDRENLTAEAADLIYHLMVVLKIGEVSIAEVLDELARRTGQSGLAEKAGRAAS